MRLFCLGSSNECFATENTVSLFFWFAQNQARGHVTVARAFLQVSQTAEAGADCVQKEKWRSSSVAPHFISLPCWSVVWTRLQIKAVPLLITPLCFLIQAAFLSLNSIMSCFDTQDLHFIHSNLKTFEHHHSWSPTMSRKNNKHHGSARSEKLTETMTKPPKNLHNLKGLGVWPQISLAGLLPRVDTQIYTSENDFLHADLLEKTESSFHFGFPLFRPNAWSSLILRGVQWSLDLNSRSPQNRNHHRAWAIKARSAKRNKNTRKNFPCDWNINHVSVWKASLLSGVCGYWELRNYWGRDPHQAKRHRNCPLRASLGSSVWLLRGFKARSFGLWKRILNGNNRTQGQWVQGRVPLFNFQKDRRPDALANFSYAVFGHKLLSLVCDKIRTLHKSQSSDCLPHAFLSYAGGQKVHFRIVLQTHRHKQQIRIWSDKRPQCVTNYIFCSLHTLRRIPSSSRWPQRIPSSSRWPQFTVKHFATIKSCLHPTTDR